MSSIDTMMDSEENNRGDTTIPCDKETKEKLDLLPVGKATYDEILNILITNFKKTHNIK